MNEMDKKLLSKSPDLEHPRELLARVISGLNWQRALNSISGREGHDRVRCMTCRFICEDCSLDVPRSQEVRHALRRLPGFVFRARFVLGREDRGGKPWEACASTFLEGLAETKGSECFVLASTDSRGLLHLGLYSQPEWLACAAQRLSTFAHGGNAAPFLTSLVGLGRLAKGLHVVEPRVGAGLQYEVVSDTWAFLNLFASADLPRTGDDEGNPPLRRVRWTGSEPKASLTQLKDLESARALFRAHCRFDDLDSFVDFLCDFRHGTATAQAKPVPRPPPSVRSSSQAPSWGGDTMDGGRPRSAPPRPSRARSASRVTRRTGGSPSRAASRAQSPSRGKGRRRSETRSRTPPSRRSPEYRRSPSHRSPTPRSASRPTSKRM